MNFEYMITRPAEVAIHRCGAMILIGPAEGIPARVDPIALNTAGHFAAITSGHEVFRLTKTGLVLIDADRVKSTTIHGPLLPDHKCGRVWPPQFVQQHPFAENAAQNEERFPF